jgi:hypothetical protein
MGRERLTTSSLTAHGDGATLNRGCSRTASLAIDMAEATMPYAQIVVVWGVAARERQPIC